MPVSIPGSPYGTSSAGALKTEDYQYQYPFGDWKPGSELHEKWKTKILQRAQESYEKVSPRHTSWDKIDNTLTAFIQPDELEKQIKSADPRRPVAVTVPLSYGVMETILSHLMAIYSTGPLWGIEGRGPEDTLAASLLELLLEAQAQRFHHLMSLHTFFRDGITKGMCIMAPYWETQTAFSRTAVVGPDGQPVVQRVEQTVFEGNRLRNIDPRLFLPDPKVAVTDVQDGEFVGWVWRSNRMEMLTQESKDPSRFNAKYLKHIDGRSRLFPTERRGVEGDSIPTEKSDCSAPIDRLVQYVKLVPSEEGFGSGDKPEIWLFELSGDEVITQAGPLNADHNRFPVVVGAPDSDGYSTTPISRMEVVYGQQQIADFMNNVHIAHMRKMHNGWVVADPSVVNIHDLTRATTGPKIIRARRSAFGTDLKGAIFPVPVPDMTGNASGEIAVIDTIMQKATGASEGMQGLFAGGERRSAQEARDTRSSAVSRIEKMARLLNEQALTDLTYLMAKHTQQYISQESYVKVTGRWESDIRETLGLGPRDNRIPVGPLDMVDIDYDIIPHDASIPGGEFAAENIQLFQIALQDPRIYQSMDTVRWMMEIARRLGLKNMPDFRIQVAPNEVVAQQQDAGNLVPVEQTA